MLVMMLEEVEGEEETVEEVVLATIISIIAHTENK